MVAEMSPEDVSAAMGQAGTAAETSSGDLSATLAAVLAARLAR